MIFQPEQRICELRAAVQESLAGGLIPGLARDHWCRNLRIAWPRQDPSPADDDGNGVVAVLMCGHHTR